MVKKKRIVLLVFLALVAAIVVRREWIIHKYRTMERYENWCRSQEMRMAGGNTGEARRAWILQRYETMENYDNCRRFQEALFNTYAWPDCDIAVSEYIHSCEENVKEIDTLIWEWKHEEWIRGTVEGLLTSFIESPDCSDDVRAKCYSTLEDLLDGKFGARNPRLPLWISWSIKHLGGGHGKRDHNGHAIGTHPG